MSGFSKVMKDGWHPEGKGGRKESWRNDFKGINQVVGSSCPKKLGSAANPAMTSDRLVGWGKAKTLNPKSPNMFPGL